MAFIANLFLLTLCSEHYLLSNNRIGIQEVQRRRAGSAMLCIALLEIKSNLGNLINSKFATFVEVDSMFCLRVTLVSCSEGER